jgi:hypothetical protein
LQGVIHDVTILHNIKLMREPVRKKYRKYREEIGVFI